MFQSLCFFAQELVGSNIAAQLMGLAGGLVALSKIPSCNVQVLGAEKNGQKMGFGAAATLPHTGVLLMPAYDKLS